MFTFWKKLRRRQPATFDTPTNVFSKSIYRLKQNIAKRLSKREQKLTLRQKKIALLIFCSCMFTYSFILLWQGFFSPGKPPSHYLDHHTITMPADPRLPDSLNIPLLEQIQKSKLRLDSLHDSLKH